MKQKAKTKLLTGLMMLAATTGAHADEVETTLMKATLTNGKTLETVLSNDVSFTGPKVIDNKTKLTIDGVAYALDEVKELRFEKIMVDGISFVETDIVKDTGVYDLQGRKVGNGSEVLTNLKKGLYIVNGKKVMVK